MMNKKTLLLGLLLITNLQIYCQEANWPQYLGPHRNAIADGAEIASSWEKGIPQKLWSVPLGSGYGGASVYGDEVFVLDREKGNADILRCFDLNSGTEKWSYRYEAPGELPYPGSRAVPTVDENYVWSIGPHGDFYCIDRKSHKPVWNFNLKESYDAQLSQWGYSQSPILYKDFIIAAPHGNKAGVIALEKSTGKIAWESHPLTGHSYHVSPTPASFGGIDQVIMISPYDRKDSSRTQEVVAFDVRSGKELWKYEGLRSFSTIAPAVVVDEYRLFLTDCSYNDNYGPVSILLDIQKTGEHFSVQEVFKTEAAGCKMHPGIYYEGHFYLNSTGKPQQMQCLDSEGNLSWQSDSIPGFDLGGMIMVNDLIINQNGRNGDIHLIQPSPEGYIELGRASYFMAQKNQAWAPMAYSQGKLLVRDLEQLVCVDLTKLQN